MTWMTAIGLCLLIVGGVVWFVADAHIPKPKDDNDA